jgi:hypothetical protein
MKRRRCRAASIAAAVPGAPMTVTGFLLIFGQSCGG